MTPLTPLLLLAGLGGLPCDPAAVAELAAPAPAASDFFAETVRTDGARVALGAYGDDALGMEAGAVYVFRREGRWALEAELRAPDGDSGDHFGRSAAVHGEHLVVGAYRDEAAAASGGSAYCYRRTGTSWSFAQKLTAPDPGAGDRFGRVVAVRGDLAAIGAPFDADVGADGGSAYLYRFDGTAWAFEQKLLPSDGTTDDRFGKAFGLGEGCVLVGASLHEAPGAAEAGAAYVYRREASAWVEEAVLRAPVPEVEERLGVSVALDGAPGGEVAVAGAPDADEGGLADCGAVYVFRREGGAWSFEQRLVASDRAAGDWFGWTVAVEGETILVGAVHEGEPGLGNAGAAYVFRRVAGVWTESAKLVAPVREAGEQLGASLDLAGGRALLGCNFATVGGAARAGRALELDLAPCVLAYCAGDGSGAACPCGNEGLERRGCDNAQGTGGVELSAPVHEPDGAGGGTAGLFGVGFPAASSPTVVLIRSIASAGDGSAFGDGLLCLAAPVVRVTTSFAVGGELSLALSHGAGAGTFRYQLWYRSNGAFCAPERFNLSSALAITWP